MKYFAEKFGCSAKHPCPAAAPPMPGDALFFCSFLYFCRKLKINQKISRSGAQTCDCHAKRTHA
jgi:hypothetical protein